MLASHTWVARKSLSLELLIPWTRMILWRDLSIGAPLSLYASHLPSFSLILGEETTLCISLLFDGDLWEAENPTKLNTETAIFFKSISRRDMKTNRSKPTSFLKSISWKEKEMKDRGKQWWIDLGSRFSLWK